MKKPTGVVTASPREIEETIADRDMWKAFGDQFGWQLYGWSYDHSASFFYGHTRQTAEITKTMREDIQRAMDTKSGGRKP